MIQYNKMKYNIVVEYMIYVITVSCINENSYKELDSTQIETWPGQRALPSGSSMAKSLLMDKTPAPVLETSKNPIESRVIPGTLNNGTPNNGKLDPYYSLIPLPCSNP